MGIIAARARKPAALALLLVAAAALLVLSCGDRDSGGARAWGVAVALDNSPGPSFLPDVATDHHGAAVAAWFQRDSSEITGVWASRYVPGSGWTPSEPVGTDNAISTGCRVAMDADGNAFVVWIRFAPRPGQYTNVWAARYKAGSGWGAPVRIGSDAGSTTSAPVLAASPGGDAVVAWIRMDADTSRSTVWSARYRPGTGWCAAERVGPADGGSSGPEVAIDGSGNAVAVWSQRELSPNPGMPGGMRVWSNRCASGGGWGDPEPIEAEGAYIASSPKVSFDGRGVAVAAWNRVEWIDNGFHVWTNRYTPGVGWGDAVRIGSGNYSDMRPSVAAASGGEAMILWESWLGSPGELWATRCTADAGWEAAQYVGCDNGVHVLSSAIGMDGSGNAVAAWSEDSWPAETVRVARYIPGAGWESPSPIDAGEGFYKRRLRLSVGAGGDAFAVWEQDDSNGFTHIRAVRYGRPGR